MNINNSFYKIMTSIITLLLLGILVQNQIMIGKISNVNTLSQNKQNSFTRPVSLKDCPCMNNDGIIDVNIHSVSFNDGYGYFRKPIKNGKIPIY